MAATRASGLGPRVGGAAPAWGRQRRWAAGLGPRAEAGLQPGDGRRRRSVGSCGRRDAEEKQRPVTRHKEVTEKDKMHGR